MKPRCKAGSAAPLLDQPEVFEKDVVESEQHVDGFPSVWDGIWDGDALPQFDITDQQLDGVPFSSFLEDDGSVIASSCDFGLSDVVGLPLPEQEMDGCWDDLGDIFGHVEQAQAAKGHQTNYQKDENVTGSLSVKEDEEATSTLQVQQQVQEQSTASEAPCVTGPSRASRHFAPGQVSSCSITADERSGTDESQEQVGLKGEVSDVLLENDNSPEVTVLDELRGTVLKLAPGTRLCIRSALYRLAKSAAARTTQNDGSNLNEDHSLSGIEKCTNPIDRIVASLLFYRLYPPATTSSSSSQASQDSVCFSSLSSNSQSKMGQTFAKVMLGSGSFSSKLPLPALHKNRCRKKSGTNRP